MEMKTWRVVWEIDIDAMSAQDAAREALAIQRDRYSTATLFRVQPNGSRLTPVVIDAATVQD